MTNFDEKNLVTISFQKFKINNSEKLSKNPAKMAQAARGAIFMWRLQNLKLNRIQSPILESNLLIGKVLPGRTPYEQASGFRPGDFGFKQKDTEVRVPYYVYDKSLRAFFEHQWDFAVLTQEELQAEEGDTVLIRRLADQDIRYTDSLSLKEAAEGAWWEPKTEEKDVYKRKDLTHEIIEVIYKMGDVVDPLKKEPVVGDRYRSEIERTAELYGKSNSDFDYAQAPKRGWQKDKRDFTHRRTYKKWHRFQNKDPYAIIS